MKEGQQHEGTNDSGIAVIGLAGRFPGARDTADFWRNLAQGVESIMRFTDAELKAAGVSAAALDHPNYVKARPLLADIDLFDAEFFGFNPREAELLDPQQRLFLECVWEALEQAGYARDPGAGIISLFAGASASSYYTHHVLANPEALASTGVFQAFLSNVQDSLATRVAYKLNLKGGCYSVQTFCSTSLVAVHLSAQALANFECDIAVAGGVSVNVPQDVGYWYQEGGILSPDGHCRPFDAKARGTIFGNGVGVVVLKRLEDALADGDFVHAVIRGTATNNDGAVKVSYTAPSVAGQAAVIVEALANAGVSADEVTYIETHGTGTSLGDPTEVAALTKAFRTGSRRTGFCALGSVKSNIGHLDAAAGVASLIKVIEALRHRQIPASLNYVDPNPEIDFGRSPFYVNHQLSDWACPKGVRIAGVSSFGIGGTNAHAVVAEAPPRQASAPGRPWNLLMVSARTAGALEAATQNLATHLQLHPDVNLADVAYTLQVGRRGFSHRRVVVCRDHAEARQALEGGDAQRAWTLHQERRNPPVVFMFPGQGAQHIHMGRELYEQEPVFREHLDACADALKPLLALDLRDVLFPPKEKEADAVATLTQTAVTQPALFAVEIALARLWQSWGIVPAAMIGHSIGEYVAACLAGVMSLEDALRLVARRGALMQAQPAGSMMVVPLGAEDARALMRDSGLEGRVGLAAANAPSLSVISGENAAMEAVRARLAAKGLEGRMLHTSHAFHSHMMEPALGPLTELAKSIQFRAPRIPYVSNLTGTWIQEGEATDPHYWARHLRQTVRFGDGIAELLRDDARLFLEVGPGSTLTTLTRQARASKDRTVASMRAAQEEGSDVRCLLGAVGRLWLGGVDLDWTRFHGGQRRQRVPLPTYPFERKRYWIEPLKRKEAALAARRGLQRREDVGDWFYTMGWKTGRSPLREMGLREGPSKWLIFLDRGRVGAELVRRLSAGGHTILSVNAGASFASVAPGGWTVRPGSAEDYAALGTALRAAGTVPQHVIHLWGLDASLAEGGEGDDSLELAFYSLLHWVRGWQQAGITDPIRLRVISDQTQLVTGEETLFPKGAMALAACRVIPQEHHHVDCGHVDVQLGQDRGLSEGQLGMLLEELSKDESEPNVALRGRQRWVPVYEPLPLAAPLEAPWREKGVYLITGGLGGVGMVLAGVLARDCHARLVLTGRSSLPPRASWDEWVRNHEAGDAVRVRIERVRALEALGAEVLVVAADVADEGQMRAALEHVRSEWGPIEGVIHAAGDLSKDTFRSVADLGSSECERQFRPKVNGLMVLERLLREAPPKFCLLTSSLSSVLGGLGYCAYAAGNLFMDVFALQQQRKGGTRWIAVNWDEWHLAEGEQRGQTALARTAIEPSEGGEAFRRIVAATGLGQVVVSTSDLDARVDQWVRLSSLRQSATSSTAAAPVHSRPELSTAYAAPEGETEQTIAEAWQKLLGIGQVGRHDNFFELGGHSLLATQLLSRLRQSFGVELSLQAVFESPTPVELAKKVQTMQWLSKPASAAPEAARSEREEIEI